MKKIKCKVCGCKTEILKDSVYVATPKASMRNAITKMPCSYNAIDCPNCGCQMLLSKRLSEV